MSEANGYTSSNDRSGEYVEVQGPTASYPPPRNNTPSSVSAVTEPIQAVLTNGDSQFDDSVLQTVEVDDTGAVESSREPADTLPRERLRDFNPSRSVSNDVNGLADGHRDVSSAPGSIVDLVLSQVHDRIFKAMALRIQYGQDENHVIIDRLRQLLLLWLHTDLIERTARDHERRLGSASPIVDWRRNSLRLIGEVAGRLEVLGNHEEHLHEARVIFNMMHAIDLTGVRAEEAVVSYAPRSTSSLLRDSTD